MPEYYKIAADRWRRTQDLASRAIREEGYDPRARQIRDAINSHNERMARFKHLLTSCGKDVSISDRPCECGRNHRAILLKNSEDVYMCPVLFVMNTCRLIHNEHGLERMVAWCKDHPLSKYISKIDEATDATYDPSLELESDNGPDS